jgi:tripartite-type tricarboxylate transporter receptor subunit TctC
MTKTRRLLLGIAAMSLLPIAGHAQEWPTRPVRIILPSAPASSPDRLTRLIAERLSKQWGHPYRGV